MKQKKLLCGVGINDADYAVQIFKDLPKQNGKRVKKRVWVCPFYEKWASMIKRGYSVRYKEKRPTYTEATVCDEWLKFSNFKAWMEQQDWEGKHLDKDILFPGNKVYSPETCAFVDKNVNLFIIEGDSNRGDYPIGVNLHSRSGYIATCRDQFTGKKEYLGRYDTPEEAHKAWLEYKLHLAKLLAEEQKDERVAKALVYRYVNYNKNATHVENVGVTSLVYVGEEQ